MTTLAFDHIGLVVADADAALQAYAATLGGGEATVRFDDPDLTVSVRFLRDASGVVYEFIAPCGANSIVEKSLRKQTNVLNQIAYRVASMAEGAAHLKRQRFHALTEPKRAKAFGGAEVQFFLSPHGFIVELIASTTHRHDFFPLEADHARAQRYPDGRT